MKDNRPTYVEFINIKTGETELRPASRELKLITAELAWIAYAKDRRNRLMNRAFKILDIYERAEKYTQLYVRKTFWQKIKELFK